MIGRKSNIAGGGQRCHGHEAALSVGRHPLWPLAERLPGETGRELSRNAYRLELDGKRLVWMTSEAGKEERYHSEPGAGRIKRIKAQVISWLPIEWLL